MIKNITLTLITTFITLLLLEIILRGFYSDYLYTGNTARKLYYSSPNLTLTEDNKSVHYTPNNDIRSIAVYYNQLEYDTKHHANNYGFLSDENYTKEKQKSGIVFLGDSFTAGVGSTTPWIPTLNKKYPHINLYSLGVTGTGTWNFYQTFRTFEYYLNFDTIVIIAISDDFNRSPWYPINKNGYLMFCQDQDKNHTCQSRARRIAKNIDYNIDAYTLLKSEEFYIFKALKILTYQVKEHPNTKSKSDYINKYLSYYINDMKKIKNLAYQLNKKVIFIHVPEKREVISGKYRCNLKDPLEKLGIKYYPLLSTKNFNLSMYHKHDAHPNDKGYHYLSSIIEEILKLKHY